MKQTGVPQRHLLPSYRRFLMLSTLLVALAASALLCDLATSTAFRNELLGGDIRSLISLSEVFAHGLGVAAILLAIWATAVPLRRKLLRVATCAFAPGIVVTLIKSMVARDRPGSLVQVPENIGDTFHGFLPAIAQSDVGLLFERNLQSFPSGHAATAAGLAIGLAWLFPRGRWCFVVFALLAMCQRVQSGAHFPSDTLVGAAIAMLVAGCLVSNTVIADRFARFEQKTELNPVLLEIRNAA